jgi:probable rRNA maturation factor
MILNRQRAVRVVPAALGRFLGRVRRELKLKGKEVTVCLVSDREMTNLNRRFRGKPGPTDVLSFPAQEAPAQRRNGSNSGSLDLRTSLPRHLGDVAIAPAVARRNARRIGRTLDDELRILILHGVLHLLGYDHETDGGEMERFEQRLRRKLNLEPARHAMRRAQANLYCHPESAGFLADEGSAFVRDNQVSLRRRGFGTTRLSRRARTEQ